MSDEIESVAKEQVISAHAWGLAFGLTIGSVLAGVWPKMLVLPLGVAVIFGLIGAVVHGN